MRIAARAGGGAAGRVDRSLADPSRGQPEAQRRARGALVGTGAGVRGGVPAAPGRRRLPLASRSRCVRARRRRQAPAHGRLDQRRRRPPARRGGAARVRGPLRARGHRLLRRRMGHRPRRSQRLFLPAHARAVRIASRAGGRAAGRVVRSPAASSRGPAAALRRGERASVGKGAGVRRRVPLSPTGRRLPLAPPPRRVRARCRRQAGAHGRLDERRRRPPTRRGSAARIRATLRARHGCERVGILGLAHPHRPVPYLAESVRTGRLSARNHVGQQG